MIVEYKFFVGLKDVDRNKKLKNSSILNYLEELGGMHSNLIGYGLNNIDETKKTWILLNWSVKVIKRPKYADIITVKTWSRQINKFYAFRDFEICDEMGNIICIATSKWVFMDTDNWKIVKISKDIEEQYETENKMVFDKEDFKFEEPKNYLSYTNFNVTRNLIDFNSHIHNTYYIDIALEALPQKIYNNYEFDNFRILYKKEIKEGEEVKLYYTEADSSHFIVIKSNDEKITHAIIQLTSSNECY